MTDFVQTMKDWRRMCKFYSATFETCCDGCPLDGLTDNNCGGIYDEEFADAVDWAEVEKRIDKWAEEHPEPKYPTWTEYFRMTGVFPSWTGHEILDHRPIPAEIAEKLGIEPKEG